MRILTLVAVVLLLAGCSQSSLTYSLHTGEVAATVKMTKAPDIETAVTEMKTDMEKACKANGMVLEKPPRAALNGDLENVEKLVEILKQLAKWLPWHTVTVQGKCVANS